MIAVVDFGAGNLRSVMNAFHVIGEGPRVTQNPEVLRAADAIVLPGVGAFGRGIERLRELDLVEPLHEAVVTEGKPFLGICLGMQLLAEVGLEGGEHSGLGWLQGTVRKMQSADPTVRIPHMGWNTLELRRPSGLFDDIGDAPAFYFLHGYHLDLADGDSEAVVATCEHGRTYVAAVERDNIRGVQFHPEKSQLAGLKLLQNFVAWVG